MLRTFVGALPANVKNSGNAGVADLEADGFGQWNDDVLDQIDQLMVSIRTSVFPPFLPSYKLVAG